MYLLYYLYLLYSVNYSLLTHYFMMTIPHTFPRFPCEEHLRPYVQNNSSLYLYLEQLLYYKKLKRVGRTVLYTKHKMPKMHIFIWTTLFIYFFEYIYTRKTREGRTKSQSQKVTLDFVCLHIGSHSYCLFNIK